MTELSALCLLITFRVRRIAETKCIMVTAVCVSVPRRIPTLLHEPGCKLEEL